MERQEKSVLSPAPRFTFLGVVWDFTTIQASLSPACVESNLNGIKDKVGSGALSSSSLESVGSHSGSGQHHSTRPTAHKTISVLAQKQGISSSEPSLQGCKGHVPWATCCMTLEGVTVPEQEPGSWGVLQSQYFNNGMPISQDGVWFSMVVQPVGFEGTFIFIGA